MKSENNFIPTASSELIDNSTSSQNMNGQWEIFYTLSSCRRLKKVTIKYCKPQPKAKRESKMSTGFRFHVKVNKTKNCRWHDFKKPCKSLISHSLCATTTYYDLDFEPYAITFRYAKLSISSMLSFVNSLKIQKKKIICM